MSLGDPFASTMETTFNGAQSGQQAAMAGTGAIADAVKQKQKLAQDAKQRSQAFGMLKNMGLIQEDNTPPSVDDLKTGLKVAGKTMGKDVHFNMANDLDEKQQRNFLSTLYKSFNIPMPKGNTKTTISPGVTMDLGGGTSYTSPKQEKSLVEQVNEYKMAQDMLPGSQISTNGKGISIKSPSTSRFSMSDGDAKNAAERIVSGADVPANFSKFQYGQIAKYLPSDFDSVKANTDYFVNKSGASGFQKLYNTIDFAEKRYSKNTKVALQAVKDFNPDMAPILKRAVLAGSKEISGDPKASRVLASVLTVANEYAKIATNNGLNGNLTDTASAKAQEMIDYAETYGQLDGLIGEDGVLTQDTQNAKASLDEVKDRISSETGMGNKAKQTLNATPGMNPQKPQIVDYKSKYGLQ